MTTLLAVMLIALSGLTGHHHHKHHPHTVTVCKVVSLGMVGRPWQPAPTRTVCYTVVVRK